MALTCTNRLRHGLDRLIALWELLQVDKQGRYATNRFRRYVVYRKATSWRRVAWLCIITPMPCIAFIILMDSVRIEPPWFKAWEMPWYWTRGTLVTFAESICTLEQFRIQKPQYHVPHRVLALIAAVATGLGILMAFVPSCYFANPLPFTLALTSPPWLAVLGGGLVFYLRHEIRGNPAAKKNLRQYWTIILTQLHLPLVYPLYHFLFSSLSPMAQVAFVPVLSVIKLAFKNVMNRALYGLDDLKPQTIILNIEVFHALFATYSMQNSSSSLTAMALVALDFFHACVSLYDVNKLLAQITALVDSLRSTKATADMTVLEIALLVINEETEDVEPEDTINTVTSLMPTVKHLT